MLAYFDCFSGISGDMTLGAFFDLGITNRWLKNTLKSIPLTGFDITVTSIRRNGINAKKVVVTGENGTFSRNYSEIKSMISNSPMSPYVKEKSLGIFDKIAVAEAGIHGCPIDKVHFHEVGGIDAIVDIVGTVLCLENLGVKKIVASKIPLGRGFVSCKHGKLPVPAPATLAILKDVPAYGTSIENELVTPTGAAIVTTLAESFGPMPAMTIEKIGYGAGQRDLKPVPNLLRVIIGPEADQQVDYQRDSIIVVETCIDDMNPEMFGFVMERLFEDGALDVYWIPIFMKKNRPGTMVQVLCKKEQQETIIHRILSETTTLGVRYYDVHRCLLARDYRKIMTIYGEVQVKYITHPDGSVRIVPEYEICKEIALDKNIPILKVYDTIAKEAAEKTMP